MDVEQPWESLDVDDSDIPSLLRPCKRLRSLTIPGPARSVQSAMLRKTLDRQNHNFADNGLVSTQDYVRKAMDDTSEFDDDFTRMPWISALQYLGVGEGVIPGTPISSIKKCTDVCKADQVVAVIKSCKSNGLGGLMVMLKDPTGTVGASIHQNVLCESEFRKNLTVGSVVILQKVAILAPVRSAHYLNITLKNLVKVFCQDSSLPSKQDNAACPPQYAHHGAEDGGKAHTSDKTFTMQTREIEDITNKMSRDTRKSENVHNPNRITKENLFASSLPSNNRASSSISTAAERRCSQFSQATATSHETPEDMIRISSDQQESASGRDKCVEEVILEGSFFNNNSTLSNSATEKATGEEIQGTNEVLMKNQSLMLKPSLPQWTDEQLDELFAGDEDDSSLL